MTAWSLEVCAHWCDGCGIDREGTLNIQTAWWTCSACQHGTFVNTGVQP